MPTPGQPLRFLWCQDPYPLDPPCTFGYFFLEDVSFYVDAGATAQIHAMHPGIEAPYVVISEEDVTAARVNWYAAECLDMCGPTFDCCSIDGPLHIDTHGYNYALEQYLFYDPPFTGATIYPHKTYSLCPHEEP